MAAPALLACACPCPGGASLPVCHPGVRELPTRRSAFFFAVWDLLSARPPASCQRFGVLLAKQRTQEGVAHRSCFWGSSESVEGPSHRSGGANESRRSAAWANGDHNESSSESGREQSGGERQGLPSALEGCSPVKEEPPESLPFGFQQALQAVPAFGPVNFDDCEDAEILPIMPLAAVKFPTDAVALQLFEPRYRAMFKLVNQTPRKRFGVVLGDRLNATMKSVGCVCEIQQYVPLPARRRILVDALAVGRFRVRKLLLDKPFVTAVVEELADATPASVADEAALAALEMRVCQCMQDVAALAVKLYGHVGSLSVDDLYNTEAWKWSLARQHEEGCTEDSLTEADRRGRFSFALARTLDDLSVEEMQQLLEDQSTSQRLQRIESALSEGRRYLAARSTLRDALP